jgi:hypothetical protein
LLLAIGVLSVRSWSNHRFYSRLSRARNHLEKHEPGIAHLVLRPLLEAGIQDDELFLLAAWTYRLKGEPARSLEFLKAAAELGHDEFELNEHRGLALFDVRAWPTSRG